MTAPAATVGFVGAGHMGQAMIARLVGAGYSVRVHDRSAEALAALAGLYGCHPVAALDGVPGDGRVVILMLPNGDIVRDVVLGTGDQPGLVATLSPGSIVVDMGSSAPWQTQQLSAALGERDVALVDAPVSGGVARATNGTLAVLAGGDPADVAQVHPLLAEMGSMVLYTGGTGSGHAAKALNNLLSAATFAATVEVLRVAETYGLDPVRFCEVLDASSGSNNTTRTKLRQFVISQTYASGFAIGLMEKDMAIAHGLARRCGVEVPLSDRAVELWEQASADLGSGSDHTAYATTVRGPHGTSPA